MPPELIPSDEEYASEEDSDFAPDAIPAVEDAESSDEEADTEAESTVRGKGIAKGKDKEGVKTAKRKRGDVQAKEAKDAGFENSGDEAIIEKGLKRQKRKGRNGIKDDDEGGEGGLVKTRSMRAQEKVEKKPLVNTSSTTVDVDALWEAMISGKSTAILTTENISNCTTGSPKTPLSPNTTRLNQQRKDARSPSTTLTEGPDSMIIIKRTYNFAGKVHTEQKLVARNSAEAKLYLASLPESLTLPSKAATEKDLEQAEVEELAQSLFPKGKRAPMKARRSIFEPIVEGLLQRTDLHFGVRKDSGLTLLGETGKEKKLNTVEKSAMDWAGFVDKEGIKDDLDAAGKSKGAYRTRVEFLARVEEKKELESRRARGLPV